MSEILELTGKGIPKGWELKKIEEIKATEKYSISMGPFGSNIKADNFVLSGVPIVKGTNLNFYKYVGGEFTFLTEEKADELKSSNCKPLDLVFTHRGTIGQVGLIPNGKYERYVVSQSGMKLSLDLKIANPHFLLYFFKSHFGQYQLLLNEAQVGVPSISSPLQSLKAVEVLLPPLPEQERIAEVLSSLDDKIDLLHRNNKTLEQLAETLFRQWFVEKADENCIPGMIKDICKLPSGYPFKSGSFIENGNYKIVTIKNVQNGYLDLKNTSTISSIPDRLPAHCKLSKGDILLSLTGNVGRVCRVTEENLLLNQRVSKVTPLSEILYEYCLCCFSSDKFRMFLEELARGTAQSNLSPIETLQVEIDVPKTDVLIKFHKISKVIFDKHLKNSIQIQQLETLRDTLLPKLMSGVVRVDN